jgi:uncharacterized protein (UPF0262 family)
MAAKNQRVAKITLDEHTVLRRHADIEHERATAIFDLLEDNDFAPASGTEGPFHLHLAVDGSRLEMDIRGADGAALDHVSLALGEFRPIIKDYFLICESYNHAIRSAPLAKITAIDQGRRALHNEASQLLRDRLLPQVAVDLDTARRLFTLLCVLQIRG